MLRVKDKISFIFQKHTCKKRSSKIPESLHKKFPSKLNHKKTYFAKSQVHCSNGIPPFRVSNFSFVSLKDELMKTH